MSRGARALPRKTYPLNSFTELGLSQPILKALAGQGYQTPTPIQAQAIPQVLAGQDLLGLAQTGTGKTAAFALPILQRLSEAPKRNPRACRVLVLAPTRELAGQIGDSFRTYGARMGVTVAVVVGGLKIGPQMRALAPGVDVLVATPGRLIDHLQQKTVDLGRTEVLVLDEVDQMLDLGFIVPIRRIASRLPAQRQSLFFSATMPGPIEALAGELLTRPVRVQVTPTASTVDKVEQKVLFVDGQHKPDALIDLLAEPEMTRVIVFTRTKRGADKLTKRLVGAGVAASAIHGDKSQAQRERALEAFRAGSARALVATDVAARGIDIDDISHVVNFDMPFVAESYVHRIGRTARAGKAGIAISLCAHDEKPLLRDIEKLTRQDLGLGGPRQHAHAGGAPVGRSPRNGQGHGHGQGHGQNHGHTRSSERPSSSQPTSDSMRRRRRRRLRHPR